MPYAKMAKNYETLVFHPNTIQQNKNILHEFRSKSQVQGRSKEDLNKLFTKLNHKCRLNYAREEKHASSAWYSNNVIGGTYGPITGFPPGSWWGIRMDCSRDHVHGPFNEDVQNGPFGVTSICTPNNTISEDIDLGNILTFTGKEYQDNPERDPLVTNYKNQIPVRLVRSYDRLNEYAPKTGYRYDGIYAVANFWIGLNSNGTKCFKFILARLNNQESAPWKSDRSSAVSKKPISTAYAVRKPFKDCSEFPSRGSYEFRKYSHRSNETLKLINFDHTNDLGKFVDVENRGAIMKQKPVSESAIVTRHVFKKSSVNMDSAITPSTSSHMDGKSILQIGNPISKAHSTNISIRTGLYDSSQTTQHDTKKSSTMPFSRTPKAMNILKTSQHIENFNLSKRDKIKSDVKADDLKTVNKFTQVDSQQNKFNNLLAVTNNVSCSPLSKKSKQEHIHYSPNKIAESTEPVSGKSHLNGHPEVDYAVPLHTQKLQNNKAHKEAMVEIEKQSTNKLNAEELKDPSKLEKLPQAMEVRNGTENPESTTAKTDYSTAFQGLKAFISLDALTPDKILQMISKEKTNPLSKLLIGNMIGLSAEQSVALKTGEVLEKTAATQKSDIKETGRKKNHKATSEDLMATRCYKFRRRKMRRRILNKPDMGKSDKVLRSRLQKDLSKSFDVLGEHHVLPQTDPQNTERVKTKIRKRKNIGNRVIGVKSTVRKYARRKKRREIMNLLIDAKVGPKVRGPRNRRLRCMNSVYTESICSSYRSINRTRSSSKPTSEITGNQAGFRDKGGLRKIKVHKRMTNQETGGVSRRSKPARTIVASVEKQYEKAVDKEPTPKKKSSNDKMLSLRNNERLRTRRSIIEGVAPKLTIRRKRKLVQTEPQEVNCDPVNVHPENDHHKKAKKNAITQCSLISGELIEEASYLRNCEEERCDDIGFVDEELYIKQEPEDATDCKSEICDSVQPENENIDDYENYQTYEFCRYTESSRPSSKNTVLSRYRGSVSSGAEEQRALSTERVSAFVPVSTMDTHERIIRLRSIGFKPIPCQPRLDEEETDSAASSSATCSRKVVKQDVTEKYNKYANGENNVVVYMDEELQYQDIEDEDKVSLPKRYKMAAACNDVRKPLLTNPQESDTSREGSIFEQLSNNSRIEQDLEAPWHGWKKVETDNRSYWIGW